MARAWPEAVLGALRRLAERHGTNRITRRALIAEELPAIVAQTRSRGVTPHQTLSRVLQDLRRRGALEFRARGTYILLKGSSSSAARSGRAQATEPRKFWIFQANPNLFDVDAYLQAARKIKWLVRQRHLASKIRPGDRVFIWRAKGKGRASAGIIASGWILERPREQPDDPLGISLWQRAPARTELRVSIQLDRVARGPREEVQREWLLEDPLLKSLRILHLASETNYLVDPAHAARIEALWDNTGRDWSRAESIAGLWAYHRTYGTSVSKAGGSPVAIVAERIGRAVGGVYNKVMNFRALDPRDHRKGLTAVSEIDRAVWEEMYDPQSQTLRAGDLEREFERLWPAGGTAEPDSVSLEEAISVTAGRGGQGFITDPRTRKAVEHHAMALAVQHYRQLFSEVEDTSKTRPYDLRCPAHTPEIRVEVKGSTGDGSEIQLTIGEIENARAHPWRTDLFLVTNIQISPGPEGPEAYGGKVRIIEDWRPKPDDLKPVVFRYRVPD